MRFVVFIAVVVAEVSAAEEHTLPPDYSAADPSSWASVAHQQVDAKLQSAEVQARDTAARKELESASGFLAKAEYARVCLAFDSEFSINPCTLCRPLTKFKIESPSAASSNLSATHKLSGFEESGFES